MMERDQGESGEIAGFRGKFVVGVSFIKNVFNQLSLLLTTSRRCVLSSSSSHTLFPCFFFLFFLFVSFKRRFLKRYLSQSHRLSCRTASSLLPRNMPKEQSFFFFIFFFYRPLLLLLLVSSLSLFFLSSSSFSVVSVGEGAWREQERGTLPFFLYVDALLVSAANIEEKLNDNENRGEEESGRNREEDQIVVTSDHREDRRKEDRIGEDEAAMFYRDSQDVAETKKQKKVKRQQEKRLVHGKTAKKTSTGEKKEKEEEQDDEERRREGRLGPDSVDFQRAAQGEGDASLLAAEDFLSTLSGRHDDRREDHQVAHAKRTSQDHPSTGSGSLENQEIKEEEDAEEREKQEGERRPATTSSRSLKSQGILEEEEEETEREIEAPVEDEDEEEAPARRKSLMNRSFLPPSSSSGISISSDPSSSSSSFPPPEDSLSSLSLSSSSAVLSPTILLASRVLQEIQYIGSGISVYLYGIVSRGYYITQEEVLTRLRESLALLDFVERYQPQFAPSEAVLTHELSVWRTIVQEFIQDEQAALSQELQRSPGGIHQSQSDREETYLSSSSSSSSPLSSSAFPSSSSLSPSPSSSLPPLSLSSSSPDLLSSPSYSAPLASGEHLLQDSRRIESRRSSPSRADLASYSSPRGEDGEERGELDLIDRELEEELEEFTREEEKREKRLRDRHDDAAALEDAEARLLHVDPDGKEEQEEEKKKKKFGEADEFDEREFFAGSSKSLHHQTTSSFTMSEKGEDETRRREEEEEEEEKGGKEEDQGYHRSQMAFSSSPEALPEPEPQEYRDEASMMASTGGSKREDEQAGDLHGDEKLSINKTKNEIDQAALTPSASSSQPSLQEGQEEVPEGGGEEEGFDGEEEQGDDEFVDEYLVSFRMTFRRCSCVLSRALVNEDYQELAWFYQTILPTLVYMARGWILILTSQYRRGVRTPESTEHELQKIRRQMSRLTTVDEVFISAIDDLNRRGNEDISSPFGRRKKNLDLEEELLRPSGKAPDEEEEEQQQQASPERKIDRDNKDFSTTTATSSSSKDLLKQKQGTHTSSTGSGDNNTASSEEKGKQEIPKDEKKKKKGEEAETTTTTKKKTSTTKTKEVEKKHEGKGRRTGGTALMIEDEDLSSSRGKRRRREEEVSQNRRRQEVKSTKKKRKKGGTLIGSAIEYLKKQARNPWMIGLVTFASLVGLDHLARHRYYD